MVTPANDSRAMKTEVRSIPKTYEGQEQSPPRLPARDPGLVREAMEVVFVPQAHANQEGARSLEEIAVITRAQYELGRHILDELKKEPRTVIFSESFPNKITTAQYYEGTINSLIPEILSKAQDATGKEVLILKKPASDDPQFEAIEAIAKNIVEPCLISAQVDGKTISVAEPAALIKQMQKFWCQQFGMQAGLPSDFKEVSDPLAQELYTQGAVFSLLRAGLIQTVYPAENQKSVEEIEAARTKMRKDSAKTSETVGDPLYRTPDGPKLMMERREGIVKENIVAFSESPEAIGVKRILLIYGAAHDFSKVFESNKNLKFSRDDSVIKQMEELMRTGW